MSLVNEFVITQIVDNGQIVQITLVENVLTEPISQKQMIMDNVAKKIDQETREQIMPLLEAILQAQPTINMRSYQQSSIAITIPRSQYDRMGRPQVGHKLEINMKKVN